MPRKLKTYQTSLGVYDLAIAAPSIKAALDAWGSNSNLFHQGFAHEVDDLSVVASTLAKPGVVLKRPVGSFGPFTEHAGLPGAGPKATQGEDGGKRTAAKDPKAKAIRNAGEKVIRDAALAFEKERKRRESLHRKAEAAVEMQRRRRDRAVAKAQAAFDAAKCAHDAAMHKIDEERRALDSRSGDEEVRWNERQRKHEAALEHAKMST
jgi:colicin import membrane protein